MESTTKRAPGLFEGTAAYYSRYRFGYPETVFDFLVERFGLEITTPVLDLGCGTGQLAIPLARRDIPVHAVDPDVEMLAEGMRVEAASEILGIAWRRGDDRVLAQLKLPSLRLCVMGASFHWTDRDALLADLDGRIDAKGGVVVLDGGKSVWTDRGAHAWGDVAKGVVQEFLGPERRAGSGIYNHPKDPHEVVLARSPFAQVEKRTFVSPRTMTIDDVIGLQLSTSYASPAQLGDKIGDFRARLAERLAEMSPSGVFEAQIEHEALVATR